MNYTLAATCLLFAGTVFGQDTSVYRLNFALREMKAGKTISSRNYTLMAMSQSNTKLNVGAKVPIAGSNSAQYTYLDLGVNVRARVQERGPQLHLNADVEVSNIGGERGNPGGAPAPRIQQLRADIDTLISIGQSTPVVSLDDPASPRRYEIEVTATKVK